MYSSPKATGALSHCFNLQVWMPFLYLITITSGTVFELIEPTKSAGSTGRGRVLMMLASLNILIARVLCGVIISARRNIGFCILHLTYSGPWWQSRWHLCLWGRLEVFTRRFIHVLAGSRKVFLSWLQCAGVTIRYTCNLQLVSKVLHEIRTWINVYFMQDFWCQLYNRRRAR